MIVIVCYDYSTAGIDDLWRILLYLYVILFVFVYICPCTWVFLPHFPPPSLLGTSMVWLVTQLTVVTDIFAIWIQISVWVCLRVDIIFGGHSVHLAYHKHRSGCKIPNIIIILSLYLCVCVCVCVDTCLLIFVWMYICMFVFVCVSLSICLCLSLSFSLSL